MESKNEPNFNKESPTLISKEKHPIAKEKWLRLEINKLNNKSFEELRDYFSMIPKHIEIIYLQGNFQSEQQFDKSEIDHVPQALSYLPKHVYQIVFEVEYYYLSSYLGWKYTKKIGNSLIGYTSSLPHSVNFVAFHFSENPNFPFCYFEASADFNNVLQALSSNVNHLRVINPAFILEERNYDTQISLELPEFVQSLVIGGFQHNHYKQYSFDFQKLVNDLILSLNSNFTEFSFNDNTITVNKRFFQNFSKHLKLLDLSRNGHLPELDFIFSHLPPQLKILRLCGNQLYTLGSEKLVSSLSKLPNTLEELDIGENSLMMSGYNNFSAILVALSKTRITTLRICEKGLHALTKLQLSDLQKFIPKTIKILSFRDSDLLGLSVRDFTDMLGNLPETIEGLDLSSNNLGRRPIADLTYLFSNLPPHIRILKLNNNSLGSLEIMDLKVILSALSPFINELDVSDNGLDRLSYTHMKEVKTFFPGTVKKLIDSSNEKRFTEKSPQIKSYDWPLSYQERINSSGNKMSIMRELLNEYLTGGSVLMRLSSFYWGLPHEAEVERLVYLIDKKSISNPDDLCYELEQIQLEEEEESLAKLICFLIQYVNLENMLNSPTATGNELLDIGLKYYEGKENFRQNYNKARQYFEKANEKGNQTCLYQLGYIYEHGKGIEKDRLKAVRYYQLGTYLGCGLAKNQLTNLLNSNDLTPKELTSIAQLYYQGDKEIIKDQSLAVKLYAMACDRHDAAAALFLAQVYQITEGSRQKDIKLAFSYYLLAFKFGSPEAQTPLERLAEETGPVNQLALSQLYRWFGDEKKATYWHNKSSEIGEPQFDIQFK